MAHLNGRLKILILEDSAADAKLIQHTLRRDGVEFDARVVDTREDFIVGIHEYKPHIVLSDHSLAGFDSMEALEIARKANINAPFILVTGTVSEEYAVSVIKAGAADYILKTNMSRLTVAVLSALSQQSDREKLKDTEAQFQATIDGMLDGVQIITYDWTYLYTNNIIAQQVKKSREELLGQTMMEVFPGIQNTTMFSELRRCMEERHHIEMENEFIFPDGTRRWFKLKMQPVTPGVLILSHDITEEKNIIHLLENQNRRIKMVNAALDRFLYSVSHEFRTPVCNGLGLINLLRSNDNPGDREEILNKLEYSIRNLDELLQNIGVFSDVSGIESRLDLVDLQKVYTETMELVQLVEERSDVKINFIQQGDVPFYSDKRRLSVIFSNIISNGIKFRDPRKRSFVDVTARVDENNMQLEFSDNGLGIKEEYLDKIFEVFFNSGDIRKGRGLGLFMVREIIEKMGGTFNVKSQVNIGTTFYVTIPNAKAALN